MGMGVVGVTREVVGILEMVTKRNPLCRVDALAVRICWVLVWVNLLAMIKRQSPSRGSKDFH